MAQTGTDITQAAADLISAFNQADWDTLRTLVAADLVYAESGTGRRVESADAYFELLKGWKEAFPDGNGTILAAVTGDDIVAQRIRWEGTHTGPMQTPAGPVEATGSRISVEASAWHHFEGGTIREIHHHLDVLTLLQQIGALPG
jgi:steroid delta-isomerase-like uncharacterized protein